MAPRLRAVRCIVHGRVQGVGFRYSTQHTARRLNASGWVKNGADGTVEVVAVGSADAISKLLRWLDVGPPGAGVSWVDTQDIPVTSVFSRFSIDY